MKVLLKIGIGILNIIYFFIKLFRTRNKITLISRQSNKPSVDFKMLESKLSEKYEVVVLCKMIDNGLKNKIKYFFHIFRQMYHIATSKVVILDTYCIPIGVLKHKKSLKVIQMWHALGSFKKFGKSIIGKDESSVNISVMNKIQVNDISEVMGMHKNYDYIFASSKEACKGFAEAFGYPLNNLRVFPLPRVDLIIDENNQKEVKKKIFNKYKQLKNKKNILYCPTFRKDNSDLKYIDELIEKVDYSKYNLILKLHPLTKYNIKDERVVVDKSFNTYEMAYVSDYIITDYSAVIFEVSLLNKPIFLYAYDKDNYMNKRDFYLNYDTDMPGKIYKECDGLLKNIEEDKFDYNKLNKFREKYISDCKISYTDDIVLFIESLID